MAICHENLAQEFVVAIIHRNLPWLFVVCIYKQILFIWKQTFFVCEQNFFICGIFFINSVFLCYCRGSYRPPYKTKNKHKNEKSTNNRNILFQPCNRTKLHNVPCILVLCYLLQTYLYLPFLIKSLIKQVYLPRVNINFWITVNEISPN